MKILFLHKNYQDYLSESFFHGLRGLFGANCVDVPEYEMMYKPLPDSLRQKLRGKGFTLYGLLEKLPELQTERQNWRQNLHTFDKIIIANIWTGWDYLPDLLKTIPREKIIILDGDDGTRLFPFRSVRNVVENPKMLSFSLKNIRYFKREQTTEPEGMAQFLSVFSPKITPLPVSFAIPKEKITYITPADKQKLFNNHIVDAEIAENWKDSFYGELGKDQYLFENEADYYRDLQISQFGITTKRAGWDCLRHYELAANGAVLCFKDLDKKPEVSAPHDLNQRNCLIYNSFEDLQNQIQNLSERQYEALLQKTYEWIQNYTTEAVAERILSK